jgi:hypothetical protein
MSRSGEQRAALRFEPSCTAVVQGAELRTEIVYPIRHQMYHRFIAVHLNLSPINSRLG